MTHTTSNGTRALVSAAPRMEMTARCDDFVRSWSGRTVCPVIGPHEVFTSTVLDVESSYVASEDAEAKDVVSSGVIVSDSAAEDGGVVLAC